MLVDGLQLTEGSDVTNLTVATGTSFPTSPDDGEVFIKLGDGFYYYESGSWRKVSTLANGKLDPSQIPSLAITDVYVVASQAAMLALSAAEQGDVAIRTDNGKTYILSAAPYSTLANWVEVVSSSATVIVGYDVATSVFGKPTDGEVVMRFRACRAYTLQSDQTNGQAKSSVAATASSVFTVAKNGVAVGTITFAASGTVGTIAIASNISFAIGDVLTITAPATADLTLADVDFTLVATQN